MKNLQTAIFGTLFLCASLMSGCGGSGDGSPAPVAPTPPATIPPVAFKDLAGTTPADAALGQPLAVQWTLPAGVSIGSVALDATVLAGPTGNQSTCVVNAGALASSATTANITIPNVCESKTAKEVRLRIAVESTTGQRTTATHTFVAPAAPASFVPLRANLPVLRIVTDNVAPIVSKDVYISGQMNLESNVAGAAAVIGGLQIRGRGNSTWGMPKKPYRLKLTDRQSLLGMPSSRDWVLLANYSDKTLLRNALALGLGEQIGLAWTPRFAFVEVYLNNRYDGVYLLAENVKVAADRVAIDELAEDDVAADVITGGYLLEVDFRRDGYTMTSATAQLPIVFQDPEEPAPAQEAYIKGYIDAFEAALHSGSFTNPTTGYAAYIDVDSFVRWYLVNELFRNVDANMWSSCWMYKPRGGKLFMGPLWDFDLAAGNADYNDAFLTSGWHIRSGPWFSRLFQDPAFLARVRQMWNEIKADELPAMFESLNSNSASLQQAQLNNFQRWPILESYVWPNYRIPGSYTGEIEYLRTWLTARMAWIDSQLNP
jgi:hypothetical protein